METNITISGGNVGVLNVAEYMKDVVNTVNQNLAAATNAPENVKTLVSELAQEVEKAGDQIPEADAPQAQKLGKNLEALSKEVASPEPDRAWYEVSLNGLKEAAEAIGEIGKPIAAVVGKLIPLLLGA
jgi:hypothetical protein